MKEEVIEKSLIKNVIPDSIRNLCKWIPAYAGMTKIHLTLLILFFLSLINPGISLAQQCLPQRIVNQWACTAGTGCGGFTYICSGNPSQGCNASQLNQPCSAVYPSWGQCIAVCNFPTGSSCNTTGSVTVNCTLPPDCSWRGSITQCSYQSGSGTCVENNTPVTYGCWVAGGASPAPSPAASPSPANFCTGAASGCNTGIGENCANCPSDCGACPSPGGASPPPPPTCGNGVCNAGESCGNCSSDCGTCPPSTTGSIRVRAIDVNPTTYICSTSPIGVNGNLSASTAISFTGPTPFSGSVLNGYNTWGGLTTGSYTVSYTPPAGYALVRRCIRPDFSGPGSVDPSSNTYPLTPTNLTWDLGFTQGSLWFQVRGGSVHSNAGINLSVPGGQKFITDEENGLNSGIVSYTTNAQFNNGTAIPNDAYLVQDSQHVFPANFSYYDYYSGRFGNKTALNNGVAEPASGVYQVGGTGDYTVNGNWDVASGKSIIIFVPGNLTISIPVNTQIRVREGGFLAFIVKGNITVNDTVGQSVPITTPDRVTQANLSGIFISDGTFTTLPSAGVDNQLIAVGTYVSKSFTLQRDLGAANSTHPGELFIFRPDLWRNAPDTLKDIEIKWQELAP